MIPVLEAHFDRLSALHEGVASALAGLPPEVLDWTPGPGMNSLAVLVTHLAGAQRYWIGDVAGGEPSGRVREAEFQARERGVGDLLALLDQTLAHSRKTLEALEAADLDAARVASRDGLTYSVAWCLAHALEHTALHLGHIELTRQMWLKHSKEAGAPAR